MTILNKGRSCIVVLALFFSTALMAADSAGISGKVTTLSESPVHTGSIELKKGWNLTGINSLLKLDELKSKVGAENLLIVQGNGATDTYDKSNVDNGTSFLNKFKQFREGVGYWIKVANDKKIDFNINYNVSKISLTKGWNLINPPKELALDQIKQQIGDNLLIIQGNGATDTYDKSNVDNGTSFLNKFEKFVEPNGYWIKVARDVDLKF